MLKYTSVCVTYKNAWDIYGNIKLITFLHINISIDIQLYICILLCTTIYICPWQQRKFIANVTKIILYKGLCYDKLWWLNEIWKFIKCDSRYINRGFYLLIVNNSCQWFPNFFIIKVRFEFNIKHNIIFLFVPIIRP